MTACTSALWDGSPAWAGIDPRASVDTTLTQRFPRVGGDRPKALKSVLGTT